MSNKGLGPVIKDMRVKGYSYSQIQAATGASKGTISYHSNSDVKGKTLGRTVTSRKAIDAYIRHQKETNPCTDCSVFYPYYVMQYDHRPEHQKLFNVSKYKDFTNDITVVKVEMEKCDLVCANCHMTRGHWRRQEDTGMIDSYEEYEF
jgi:hypothetical protein